MPRARKPSLPPEPVPVAWLATRGTDQLAPGDDRRGRCFRHAELAGIGVVELVADRTDFRDARMDGFRAERGSFVAARFEAASLADAVFTGARLIRARFDGARLSRAALSACACRDARFAGADLTGARLDGTDFTGAVLANARLAGAIVTGACFRDADLTGADWGDLDDPAVLFGLTEVHESRGELDLAASYHERLLALEPDEPENWNNYGAHLYYLRRDFPRAELHLREACRRFPDAAGLHRMLAITLSWGLRRYADADAVLAQARALDPDDAAITAAAAWVRFCLHDEPSGAALATTALARLPPDDPTVVECLLCLYLQGDANQRAEAFARLRQAITDGVRTQDWDFAPNIARAIELGHPHARWLERLARVVNGVARPATLARWTAWSGRKISRRPAKPRPAVPPGS